ncbi:MAG: DNA polymerase III subunit gamma/tau [Candidatus Shapirobacteria bacterium]
MSVFHLKYRPLKIADLDLPDVSEILTKVLKGEDVPQSFLFSGPKGAGKTSAARILARSVNCLKPDGVEPCGECDNCLEILNNSSLDIIEIDAASNRGIDDVRSLKDKAYLMPSKLKKKVFIIDEVHMMTKDAFNALLKLIEEPPKHTIFVLCTTDPEKIPDTVLSRLIKVDFRKGNKKELLGSINKIIKGEKIEIEPKAIDLIVERSDGSFRNLQRTFNEIYLQIGKKINLAEIEKFFNNKSGDYSPKDLEKDLANSDVKLILEKLELMAIQGVDFSSFRQNLMIYFQKKILANFGVGSDLEKSKLNITELEFLFSLLIKAAKQEKEVEIDQLPLELVVVEFCSKKEAKPSVPRQARDTSLDREALIEEGPEEKAEDIVIVEEEIIIQNSGPIELEKVESEWGNVLMAVKPYNHSVEAFLRAARPKSFNGNLLILEVFYPFHKDRLEEAKNRKIVEMGLTKVFGVSFAFECILAKSKKQPLVIKNDTPVENISEQLAEENKKDLYDVAKEIFG